MGSALNMVSCIADAPPLFIADHACAVCLVLSSTQDFSSLKPADVAAMVNHCNKVWCGDALLSLSTREAGCVQSKNGFGSAFAVVTSTISLLFLARAKCVADLIVLAARLRFRMTIPWLRPLDHIILPLCCAS